MVLLRSCCCWQSVRNGSLASGIYTMTFYSVIVTAGSFHVHTIIGLPGLNGVDVEEQTEPVPVLLIFSILMLAFAALSVMTSVVLIVGLCTNNRMMLLPWIVCITMTTILDVILSFYLLSDSEIDPFFGVLVATDYIICALNVYCILCVTSQFQEYGNGRNRPCQANNPEGPPAIHFEAASSIRPNQSPARMVTVSIIPNNGSPTSSICRPLLPSGGTSVGRTALSSNLNTTSSPSLMLSRSSFSSTSEISFYSSDLLSSSRRSSALPSQDVKQGLSPVGEVNSFLSPSAETSIAVKEDETEENHKISTELCGIEEVNVEDVDIVSKYMDENVEMEEKDDEAKTPTTSKFRVSGAFSSLKMSRLTKIEIPELPERTDIPIENPKSTTHSVTSL